MVILMKDMKAWRCDQSFVYKGVYWFAICMLVPRTPVESKCLGTMGGAV